MELYLGYIPFISIDAIMQTGGSGNPYFNVSDKNNYTKIETDNLRILDNGKISFIVTLETSSISNFDYDKYNAVITEIGKTGRYRIYKIKSIAYTSATNYLITADPTYVDATDNSKYLDPTNLKSKTSFIKYGYAYDSIVNASAKINLSNKGDKDIYIRNPNFIEPNLPIYHKKLEMDNCEYNSSLTSAKKNLINTAINKYVLGWVIIYLNKTAKPRITDGDDPSDNHVIFDARYQTDDTDNIQMPFSVAVAPLLNKEALATDNINLTFRTIYTSGDDTYDSPYVTADNVFGLLNAFIVNGSAEILYVKVCKTLPFRPEIFNNITVTSTDIKIYLTASPVPYFDYPSGNSDYFIEGIGSGIYMLFVPQFLDCRTKASLPISMTTLVTNGYPTGYKTTDTISKNDFKSINNPYITANTYTVKVRDMVGGEYSYTPLQLGHFDNLRFKVLESLTPDTTKTYVWVDPTITTDGLIAGHYAKENFMGLVNSTDFSYPYSQSQLDIFLANNKNFFEERGLKLGMKFANTVMGGFVGGQLSPSRDASSNLLGIETGLTTGETIGVSGLAMGMVNALASLRVSNYQLDDLQNAPQTVSNVNGNIFFNLQYSSFGYFIDLYTVNDYTKNAMYRDFIQKGMYLNRYLDSSEVTKYVSITINEFDKRQYKYVEGIFEFYTTDIVSGSYSNMNYIKKINSIYGKGVTIYAINNIKLDNPTANLVSYNPTYEIETLSVVDEEELN